MSEATETKQRLALADLTPKMKFEGKVVKTELFGAFIDVGAEKDGLVHISQVSHERVNRVTDVLNEGDTVTVWVQNVDSEQGRLGLTMIEPPERTISELKPEQVLAGTVTKLAPYGAFVDIGVGRDGLVHISEMSEGHISKPADVVQEGAEIQVRVVKIDRKKRRIELSLLDISTGDDQVETDEDGEESPPTAMELAWQDAMKSEGMSLDVPTRKQGKRQKKADIRRQQAAIIARTLRTHEG